MVEEGKQSSSLTHFLASRLLIGKEEKKLQKNLLFPTHSMLMRLLETSNRLPETLECIWWHLEMGHIIKQQQNLLPMPHTDRASPNVDMQQVYKDPDLIFKLGSHK